MLLCHRTKVRILVKITNKRKEREENRGKNDLATEGIEPPAPSDTE
jgi:hypothetical protein